MGCSDTRERLYCMHRFYFRDKIRKSDSGLDFTSGEVEQFETSRNCSKILKPKSDFFCKFRIIYYPLLTLRYPHCRVRFSFRLQTLMMNWKLLVLF